MQRIIHTRTEPRAILARRLVRHPRRLRRSLGRGRGGLAAGLAVTLFCGLMLPSPSSAQSSGPKLLMLPFVVHTSEPPEYVRGGLSDMLSTRFSRIGAVSLDREEDPAKATSSLDKALAAGRAANADYVLFGSFTRFGKGASLDVWCAPIGGVSREPLREIFVHSGSIGEIIPDLDELAGKVSRFARGEIVASGEPGPGARAGAATLPAAELAELVRRVAALEAEVGALRGEAIAPPTPDRAGPREYGAE